MENRKRAARRIPRPLAEIFEFIVVFKLAMMKGVRFLLIMMIIGCSKDKSIDPLNDISSQYEVETLQIRFESSPRRVDTTRFTEEIRFIKESDGLRVQHGKGYIDRLCEYSMFYEGRYIYSFPHSASNGSTIYIDVINQELEVSSRIGGIGSGTIYQAVFKY